MSRYLRVALVAIVTLAGSAFWPEEVVAQRRVVRRPPARVVYVARPRYYYRYSAFYYPGFYNPFFFSPWYAQYPYPPYGWGYRYDTSGSARLQVTPKNAEVYVDGYFVGTVDDFDGTFQRLHLDPGEHELEFHLEGYRTIREKMLFRPGATLKVKYTMQPIGPGDTQEPRPKPAATPPQEQERRRALPSRRSEQADFGTLALRVQPSDALVLIDGEEWDLPEGEDRFVIDLPEGPHRIEVRKEGYRTYLRAVDIRRGRTMTLNVSLTAGRDDGAAALR